MDTDTSKPPILTLQNISYSYHSLQGETLALSNISFQVAEGEFVAIVGPSGCGKSTLLSIIARLIKPENGTILIQNPDGSIHYPHIGYMLQKDYLFEWRTVYENVILGLELNKKKTKENLEYVNTLLQEYGLYDFKDKKPSELSGGMKQRAALIRTLALKPQILLLDEPFSALDYQTRLQVSGDIGNIIHKSKITAILVTHDLSEAISMADRVLILSHRPAALKKELPIVLTKNSDSLIASRNAPEFASYFNILWEALSDEDQE